MHISHGILISSTPDQIPDEELESFSESGPIARFFQSSEPHDPHPAAPRRGKGERIVERRSAEQVRVRRRGTKRAERGGDRNHIRLDKGLY